MLRERNGPHRPSFNFVRTSHSSASYRAYRPGIRPCAKLSRT